MKFSFTGRTAQINQRYDITDLLQIPTFIYDSVRYLIDVPVIDSEVFLHNKVFYLDKVLSFLLGFDFEENRMVSDNLEFRFLNTDSIRSYLLSNCLVQGKNLYKGVTFLDKIIPTSIADSPDKIPLNNDTWIISGTGIPIESTEIDGEALKIYQQSGFGGLVNARGYNTTSPYSIVLNGNYGEKISPLDIIRIKGAAVENVNGQYHVLNVIIDRNKTIVYTIEKINQSSNEGTLYYSTYEPWRRGGPDNIVRWDGGTKSWSFTTVNIGDAVTIKEPVMSTLVYSEDYNFSEYSLKLPLNMKIKIIVDRNAVTQNGIDLEEQRDEIKLEVSKYLQLYMTGTDIIYYPSTIIEFITEPRRLWIKGMIIYTTDSTTPKAFEFKNGIETYPEYIIRDNISDSKLEILKYSSAFFWWNVDNIKIEYELNS